MADKRFYWLKLRDDFYADDGPADFLMSQKDGANYVVLYQMLCLKTINSKGRLENQIGDYLIRYDIEKIYRIGKYFSIDTIRIALNLYKALGLVYEEKDGTLVIADYEKMVGSETTAAERKRRQRLREHETKFLTEKRDAECDVECDNVTIEKEKDIRDKENKRIDTDIDKKEEEKPVFTLLLNDGTEYPIYQEYVDKMQELYPIVDVKQAFRNMSAWCINNPKKRKTKSGITRFMNSWLSSEQNKGGYRGAGNGSRGNYGNGQKSPVDYDIHIDYDYGGAG